MNLNCLRKSKPKKMQLLIFITKKTQAAEFSSVKILASKKLVFSKYTWGKASQARPFLKTMNSGPDQGLS